MARRSKFLIAAALVAALATAGCFPVVSNQQASQQDLIGDVSVRADVCTAPQLLAIIFGGGPFTRESGTLRSSDLRRFGRIARGGGGTPDDIFACPDEAQLNDWLDGDDELAAIFGLPHQVLMAYRVPDGAEAPASFEATGTTAVAGFWQQGEIVTRGGVEPVEQQVNVTFRRASEMDAQIGDLYDDLRSQIEGAPPIERDGTKLVGYISDQLPGPLVGDMTVAAGFGVPAGTVDQPAKGTFNALTLAGSRIALTAAQTGSTSGRAGAPRALRGAPAPDIFDPERPVECLDEEITGPAPRGGIPAQDLLGLAWCPMPSIFFSGTPEEVVDHLTEETKGVDVEIRDLRVLGGEAFAEQGTTASVPFTLRGAGDPSSTVLGLSAATGLAGATATPANATVAFPGAGDHAQSVNVPVPADAAPGTYDVTLTATVGGQTRSATGRVVVLPKPAAAASRTVGRDNVYMDKDGNIAFGWICPPACGGNQVDVAGPKAGIAPRANTAAVSKPRLLRIARGKFSASTGKRARVKVRLFPRARKAIRKGRSVKAIIVVRTGGKGVPSVRRVTIKQRKPKK